jgi:capsule biosynthesis phosphatase
MRISIDLDGTICHIKEPHQSYSNLTPVPGVIEKIKELRNAGHYIIISTARNMATQDSNLGKVIKNIGKITLDWLEKYHIEYDEIYFGKPNAEIYIDDRAIRFSNWEEITEDLIKKMAKKR